MNKYEWLWTIKLPIVLVGPFKGIENLFQAYSSKSGLCRLQICWMFAISTPCTSMAYFYFWDTKVILNVILSTKFRKYPHHVAITCCMIQDNSAGMWVDYVLDNRGFWQLFPAGEEIFLFSKAFISARGSPCLLFNEYGKLFLQRKSGCSVKLTTHLMKYGG
jgi:hypothetical protein